MTLERLNELIALTLYEDGEQRVSMDSYEVHEMAKDLVRWRALGEKVEWSDGSWQCCPTCGGTKDPATRRPGHQPGCGLAALLGRRA